MTGTHDDYSTEDSVSTVAYDTVAVIIFIIVSLTFLFPCNRLIPLDRRSVAVLGATLCYITRAFIFSARKMDVITAIDFNVLVSY